MKLLENVTFSIIDEILAIVFDYNGSLSAFHFTVVNFSKYAFAKLPLGLHELIQLELTINFMYNRSWKHTGLLDAATD